MQTRMAFSVLVIVILLAGCRTAPVHNITRSDVPPGLSAEFVGKVIKYAAGRRGWTIDEASPGHIVASILRRDWYRAVVDISYGANFFSITYRDSENLGYDGVRIHRNYNSWVIKLERTIHKELSRSVAPPRPSLE